MQTGVLNSQEKSQPWVVLRKFLNFGQILDSGSDKIVLR